MKLQHFTYTESLGWNPPLSGSLDSPRTLVLVFAAPKFADSPAPFAALAGAFPHSVLAGCSTAGEIAGTEVNDNSLSVAVACFEHTELRQALTAVANPADAFHAGARLAAQLADRQLRAVFVLSDGVCVNGSALVDGLARHLPAGVIVTGGLAGDGSDFKRTWIVDRDGTKSEHVCAVGFYGDRVQIGHGCDGGWLDFGPERRITRSVGNVLYELDGKPALDLYKTYLGDRADGLPSTALLFPLAVKRDSADQGTLVRTILGIDESQQSLTFAGDLPAGGVARLMRANAEQLIDSAGRAAVAATEPARDSGQALVISVSCVGRRLVLGERTEEEVETVVDSAPDEAVHIGFYSYGEISPAVIGGASELHNQTMTVTVLSER
jgi:hypothetical protein